MRGSRPCAKIFVVLLPRGMTRGYILAFMKKGGNNARISGLMTNQRWNEMARK
jgi:hypothetical protein